MWPQGPNSNLTLHGNDVGGMIPSSPRRSEVGTL